MPRLLLILLSLALSQTLFAADSTTRAQDFFKWLESHRAELIHCDTQVVGEVYKLCDGTEVRRHELAQLFKLEPSALVKELRKRGVDVEILCDPKPQALKTFANECSPNSTRAMFKEMSGLHGQYLPEERTILIRSSALKGSLIHEYVHFLQSENQKPLFGKIYKQTKNQIKKDLTNEMDKLILDIKNLEKAGKNSEVSAKLKPFMTLSSLMQDFGPWQDLIDEREIFLLYIEHGNEFGADNQDRALAKKNMGFICESKTWAGLIPGPQCAKTP